MNKDGAFIFEPKSTASPASHDSPDQYILFQHGVMFQPPIKLERSPIHDFFLHAASAHPNRRLKILRRKGPPFFSGLDAPDPSIAHENLNCCIFACPVDLWLPLRGFLENAAVVVPPRHGLNEEPQVIRFFFEPLDVALQIIPGNLDIATVYVLSALTPTQTIRLKGSELTLVGETSASLTPEERQPTNEEKEIHQQIIQTWEKQKAKTPTEEENRENPGTLATNCRS